LDEIRDFSQRKHFPGTLNNEFDRILRKFDDIEKIPASLFSIILFLLATSVTYPNYGKTLILFAFFVGDWLLLYFLPKKKISFGPPKPPTLILALLRLPFVLFPFPIWVLFELIGTILVIYGFWIEPQKLTVTYQTLETDKCPEGFSLRVLHLGDLHLERITQREKQLNTYIQQLKPDLILFSGDFLNLSYNEDPVAIQQVREILKEWNAPLGVFAVTGSEAVDLEHIVPDLLAGLSIYWLKNETVIVEKDSVTIAITGLPCSHRPFLDEPVLQTLAQNIPNAFSILLYHSPDLAPNAAKYPFDLMLSGHTHGGQVCLPIIGPLFTASLYGRQFQSGRYQIRDLVLYITRGIGLEGKAAPRVRFLCPPEIILWEIRGASPRSLTSLKEENS
jgi:predicted MPP superfamily phosphohydrolase